MMDDIIIYIHIIISYHINDTTPEYLAHRDRITKESACEKCIEMESQLKRL